MNSIAIINPDASDEIRGNLVKLDIEPVPIPKTCLVQEPIAGHPDIQVFVQGERVFCHPDIDTEFIARIGTRAHVTVCTTRLSMEYPGDVPYNIACAGTHAFHHRSAIDPAVAEYLRAGGIALCGVSQGYAKCSTLIVGEDAIISADASITGAAAAQGLDTLLIRPGHIDLPGYSHGFIGGATGLTGCMVLSTGTLAHHPDYEAIAAFIEDHGKMIKPLSRHRAADLGTIFVL